MTPKRIWQFWHAGHPQGEAGEWVAEWAAQDGWTHALLDTHDAHSFLADHCPDLAALWNDTPRRFPDDVWRQRADILRCGLLHTFGGVWLDTDMQPLGRSLDPLTVLGPTLCWERDGVAAIGLIASPPGSPYLGRVRAGMPEAFRHRNPATRRSDTPIGPHYWTSLLAADVTVLAQTVCYPYGWRDERPDGPFPDSLMVHHWHSAPGKRP